jgi:hypothetical protein
LISGKFDRSVSCFNHLFTGVFGCIESPNTTQGDHPHLPVPAGAITGDWKYLTDSVEDVARYLARSRHNVCHLIVEVQGQQ